MALDEGKAKARPKRRATQRRATTQTIEQIEARVHEIDVAERTSLAQLAEFLREQAVALPGESNLQLMYVRSAKTLDLWKTDGNAEQGYRCGMQRLVGEIESDREERAMRLLLDALEEVPAGSGWYDWAQSVVVDVREKLAA